MMNDVNEILGGEQRPSDTAGHVFATAFNKTATVRPTGKHSNKVRVVRPNGMAREVFNLLKEEGGGDLAQLMPSSTSTSASGGFRLPKAGFANRPCRKWRIKPFTNAARKDGLSLHHWARVDAPDDCLFAKFNKKVNVVAYTDEEYEKHLTNADWTKAQTDHLVDLAKTWIIIHDRWDRATHGTTFDVESLKQRYYNMCNTLARVSEADGVQRPMISYDAVHNRKRKEQLEKLWARTHEEIEEEEHLAAQLKRIEARKRERERKAADLQKLIAAAERAPQNPAPVSIAAATALIRASQSGANLKQRGSVVGVGRGAWALVAKPALDSTYVGIKFSEQKAAGAHLRSAEMKLPNIGQKKFKAIETALERFGSGELNPRAVPNATGPIAVKFNELRSDMALLYELHLLVQSQHFTVQELRMKMAALTDEPAFELSPSITTAVAEAELRVTSVLTATAATASTSATRSTVPAPVSPGGIASRKRRLHSTQSTDVFKKMKR